MELSCKLICLVSVYGYVARSLAVSKERDASDRQGHFNCGPGKSHSEVSDALRRPRVWDQERLKCWGAVPPHSPGGGSRNVTVMSPTLYTEIKLDDSQVRVNTPSVGQTPRRVYIFIKYFENVLKTRISFGALRGNNRIAFKSFVLRNPLWMNDTLWYFTSFETAWRFIWLWTASRSLWQPAPCVDNLTQEEGN